MTHTRTFIRVRQRNCDGMWEVRCRLYVMYILPTLKLDAVCRSKDDAWEEVQNFGNALRILKIKEP